MINAITDAIGNNKLEMPATPDRVWHAIHGNALREEQHTMYKTTYHRASSVDEAAALFAKGSEAKYLAGGHTLLPVMKQRLAAPSDVIDLAQDQGSGRHRGVRRHA